MEFIILAVEKSAIETERREKDFQKLHKYN